MLFPIDVKRKPSSYQAGAAKFGALREGGKRIHAGSDLYCTPGTPVIAITDGVVRDVSLAYYRNVQAIAITHPTFVGRYCEIELVKDLKVGTKVKEGQVIGYVKKINGIEQAMLHFERFSNTTSTKPLTDRTQKGHQRRPDVEDPTMFLNSLSLKEDKHA